MAADETIIIRPVLKAYWEYLVLAAVLLLYEGLGLLVFLGLWLVLRRRRYEVTPVKITAWSGKSSRVLRIDRITDIIVKQDTIQKTLDVGTVRVLSTDEALPALDIKGIPFPSDLAQLLRQYRKKLQGPPGAVPKKPKKPA